MEVKLYTLPDCPKCEELKNYLSQKEIEFEDYDLSKEENKEKALEMIQKTNQKKVPVIEVNGTFVVGFQRLKINYLLGF